MEYEYKYRLPDKTDFKKFRSLVDTLIMPPKYHSHLGIKSDDYYFSKQDDFLRYRTRPHEGGRSELTIKKKLHKDSVSSRVEVNLETTSTYGDIEAFAKVLGYKFNFSINKYSDVWTFEDVILAHYEVGICNVSDVNYNFQAHKAGHFVEIEIVNSMSSDEAFKILNRWEKYLKPFGITKKNRVNASLFDMYRCSKEKSSLQKKIDKKLLNRTK